jgi:LemA protein
VRELNTKVESFPSNMLAGIFHVTRADYFEETNPETRDAPRISFRPEQ